MQNHIAPSILSADFNILGEQIAILKDCGITWLHYDVMDGVFVPQISFGQPVMKSIRPASDLYFDCHLMIVDPIRHIETFAASGSDSITFHVEAADDPAAVIREIRACGKKAGISVKPKTPFSAILPYMEDVDLVLVMTVEPGFGGQKYMADMEPKIAEVRSWITEHGLDTDVQVDGGIAAGTIARAAAAGANVLVAGSAAFRGDIRENISALSAALEAD